MIVNSDKELWIFLSHSNKDFGKVRKIRNYLEEHSCRPLMFYLMCLSNDEEIDSLIKREIDCRTRFIICSSENSKASKWVKSEVDYIKSRQRTYEIIDLSESDEIIRQKLDIFLKSMQVFLHFSRNDEAFVDSVYSHLRKYDMRIVGDMGTLMKNLSGGNPFHQQVQEYLESCLHLFKEFGFVVFFASETALTSHYVKKELDVLIRGGCSVFAVLLDGYASLHFQDYFMEWGLLYSPRPNMGGLPDNRMLTMVDVSTSENKLEATIEGIVNRSFPCWDTYTMAENFLRGVDGVTDHEEAERLFKIAYHRADELDSVGYPGGTLYLAKCEANGYGTKKDLQSAIHDYHSYLRQVGGSMSPELEAEISQIENQLNESAGEIRYSHKHFTQ